MRGGRVSARRPRLSGLTLVEVVVAMALLSLVILALGASLRTMAASAQKVDERVEIIDEMRVASALLGEVLARPALQRSPANGRLLFAGTQDSLSWVGVMPARFGAAGRHYFRLAVERQVNGAQPDGGLVLRFAPVGEATQFPDWDRAESRVLVRGVQALDVAYDGVGLAQAWRSTWTDDARLPRRVRLQIQVAAGPWPPLVVPMRSPGVSNSLATFGGGGQ